MRKACFSPHHNHCLELTTFAEEEGPHGPPQAWRGGLLRRGRLNVSPLQKSFFVLHDCYACIPGLEFAYDNEGSSGHGWRLDSKICEVLALTARAFCGSISLQIEIDSHNTSHTRSKSRCDVLRQPTTQLPCWSGSVSTVITSHGHYFGHVSTTNSRPHTGHVALHSEKPSRSVEVLSSS